MWKLASTFVRTVVPGVARPLHILWNEFIGFVFVIFAVSAVPAGWRYYRAINTDPNNVFRFALTAAFGLVMLWFAVGSFVKARRIRGRQTPSA